MLLRNGLCNSYSGTRYVLQLLATASITILHTTTDEAARNTTTPAVGNNICYWSSYYKEWSCEGRSICIGYQVETLCGNNTDCFKLWNSTDSHRHPILPQVTTHPASVNHTGYRTIGVHVVHQRSCLQEASCLSKPIRRPYRTISCSGQESTNVDCLVLE